MPIDYRDLLRRYINHVGDDVEGSCFLADEYRAGFSDEEWAELKRLSNERLEIGQIIEVGGRKLRITRVNGSMIDSEPLP